MMKDSDLFCIEEVSTNNHDNERCKHFKMTYAFETLIQYVL